jgi:hypothetical protein
MAIKYLSSLNLNNNELQNAAVHVLAVHLQAHTSNRAGIL